MEIYYFIAAFILLSILVIKYKSRNSIDDQIRAIKLGPNNQQGINDKKLKSYMVSGTDSCIVNCESKKEAIETYSHFYDMIYEKDLLEIDVNMPSMFRSCVMSKDQVIN